jgi:hypothetical protein
MKNRRRLISGAIAPAIVAALPVALAFAAGDPTPGEPSAREPSAGQPSAGQQSGGQQSAEPSAGDSVVAVDHVVPARRKVVHRKFRPWSHPTSAQVHEIIYSEALRWRVPAASLARRVECESHFQWSASNGQFQGVLQFSPEAFYRGLRTIRDRRVTIVREKIRRVHEARVTHYSNGRKVRRRTTPRRQRLVVVYTGKLARTPSVSDSFAQIRIGAQAIRGISAVHSSEWSCSA